MYRWVKEFSLNNYAFVSSKSHIERFSRSPAYKLIAVDLDKTLLDDNHKLSKQNRDALRRCKDMGVYVVLASGREVETIERYSDELGIYDPIIACVGSIVCSERIYSDTGSYQRQLLSHKPLPLGLVDEIMNFTMSEGWCLTVHYPDKILALEQNKYTDIYHNQTGATFTFVSDFYEVIKGTQPTKLIIIVDPEIRDQVYKIFLNRWGDKANITRTNPEYVEVNAKGVNKGTALVELCRKLGLDVSDVIAFGDNYSDLPMLQVAGGKVLMGNASEEIISELKLKFEELIIAPPNYMDGVAKILNELF